MEERYDVVIIGAGPAGLTAAIYASRANLEVLIIEAAVNGGKLSKTYEIGWNGVPEAQQFRWTNSGVKPAFASEIRGQSSNSLASRGFCEDEWSIMARIARVVALETPYHVTHRGNHRSAVFFEEADRERHLALLVRHADLFQAEKGGETR